MSRFHHFWPMAGLSITLIVILLTVNLCGCGKAADNIDTGPTSNTTQTANNNTGGLTSAEASNLAWVQAKKTFGDAVLWWLAPVPSRYSTTLKLDSDWQHNDRSAAWFVWYADPAGENWLLITITGKSITNTDIGTRGSVRAMSTAWPRQSTKVSMKDAAAAADKQGANLSAITWVEFSCDYAASDYRSNPVWVFACSEALASGGDFDYRIFVDAITGAVRGALNDREESIKLPIDLQALQQTHAVNHQADLLQFFAFITKGDVISAVRQLAYQASPNEAMSQLWLANFQSIKSLKVVSVEQYNLAQWTNEWESYKVVLDIATAEKPEKYGWENGRNTRWITLIPQGGGAWKVAELAQNP